MSTRILALFAKAPRPGEVKTRLVPPLSAEQAAELYRCMLLDVIEQSAEAAAAADAQPVLWYTPLEERAWFGEYAPGWRLIPQRGPDLAWRMRGLFRLHAVEGADRIVLRGTDSPTLPAQRIADAFAALDEFDAVLCPDEDGGYNLVGLRQPCDALFEIEFSTADVLDRTRRAAAAAGLRLHTLPAHHDVDTAEDLARLRASNQGVAKIPRTRDWLERHPGL